VLSLKECTLATQTLPNSVTTPSASMLKSTTVLTNVEALAEAAQLYGHEYQL
jgi:hypothetical protein